MNVIYRICCIASLLFGMNAHARWPSPMRMIGTEHGLSHEVINAIIEDDHGFIWIATEEGLNRFDGHSFQTFYHRGNDPKSLSHNQIFALAQAPGGKLWVGTDRGLDLFDPITGEAQKVNLPQLGTTSYSSRTRELLATEQGLWVGSGGGLYFFPEHNASNPQSFRLPWGQRVFALALDDYENIWIGTDEGLGSLNLQSGAFSQVLEIRTNTLSHQNKKMWAATRTGLYVVNTQSHQVQEAKDLSSQYSFLNGANLQAILAQEDRRVWFGGLEDIGWLQPNQAKATNFVERSPQWSYIRAECFFKDSQGNLWIGSRRGLFIYNQDSENFMTTSLGSKPFSLSDPAIFSLHETPDTFIFIGHGKGLDRLDPITGRITHYPPTLEGQGLTTAIAQFTPRQLILGGDGGLYTFETTELTYERFETKNGALPSYRVLDIYADEDTVLAGHTEGIWHIDPKSREWKALYPGDTLGQERNFVYVIERKDDKTFLVGTRRGLVIFRPEEEDFRFTAGALANMDAKVFTILKSKNGIWWLGTDSGLIKIHNLEQGTYESFETRDGLPSAVIYSLLEDRANRIWLTTNQGLSRLTPDPFEITNFTTFDGLLSNEFNMGAHTACRDGALIFGGPLGIHRFYPSDIEENLSQQPPYFTYLYLNDQGTNEIPGDLNTSKVLNLPKGSDRLSLGFTNFSYAKPNQTFAYKLEGVDKAWHYTQPQASYASYTYIPSGRHTLSVKVAHTDGPVTHLEINKPVEGIPSWLIFSFVLLAWTGLLYLLWGRKKVRVESESETLVLSHEVNQFLATTSHELRTPLNGIIGLSDSLLSGDSGDINDRQRTNLNLIMTSARRLAHMVDNILDFSSLQEGGSNLKTTTVILPPLVEEVLRLAIPAMERRNKRLTLYNDIPDNFPEIRADEERVHQMLINLVDNAIKFTESGYIRVEADVNNGYAVIRVEDTGPGIPAERHDEIFDAFKQMEHATVRLHEGAGLGLSIVKQLVQEHNGRIWVDSKVGLGSTFNFTLPLLDSSLTSLPKEDALEAPTIVMADMPTILVVDDDAINRRVLTESLGQDYSMLEAPGGQEALELLEQVHVDLVLLDVMMPGMSGFETCRIIRKTRAQEDLPILFLTARNQQADLERGYEAGGNDFLVKPFERAELRMRLETHLNLIRARRRVQHGKRRQKALAAENQALAQERQRIEAESLTDPLTKLYNRRYAERYLKEQAALILPAFDSWLHAEGSKAEAMRNNICLFLMDMDHFKSVNDTYGHDAGDKVLIDLADILRTTARGKDQVIRWGGEEFLIISHLPNRDSATGLAERFRLAIENHTFVLPDGQTIKKTCSIGFAYYPFVIYSPEAVSWQQAITLADGALYTAKLSGRNRWIGITASGNTPVNDIPQNMVQNLANLVAEGIIDLKTGSNETIRFPE